MGLFSKIFGGKSDPAPPAADPAVVADAPDHPDVAVILRRGMNVPSAEYLEQVVARAFPEGLPASVPRVGLSQPTWFKTEEVADAIAASAVETFGKKYNLEEPSSRRRVIEGPDGCPNLLVELRRG